MDKEGVFEFDLYGSMDSEITLVSLQVNRIEDHTITITIIAPVNE
jgi:hypothetical protein